MRPNPLKRLWSEGHPVVNAWLSIGNAFTAEIMAEQGYDSITLDLQHGVIDYQAALSMMQAMRASGVPTLARVEWLDPTAIMKVLDAGAYGVICPMINDAAQAAELVSYLRYPPVGVRSFGPTRASVAHGGLYDASADDQILGFAMIETAAAFAEVERIVATPGLDGVYVGPADLTLGLTGRQHAIGVDREESEVVEAIQHICAVAHAAGIRAGLHCGSVVYAARAIEWGFDLVTLSSDARLLSAAAAASVSALRASMAVTSAAPAAPVSPRVAY
jgi:4-hydroxy-2-oxoheptanedioate aldolase